MNTKTPGQTLAALRKKTSHTCPECGQVFTAYVNAIYCGALCRKRANLRKHKQTS